MKKLFTAQPKYIKGDLNNWRYIVSLWVEKLCNDLNSPKINPNTQ